MERSWFYLHISLEFAHFGESPWTEDLDCTTHFGKSPRTKDLDCTTHFGESSQSKNLDSISTFREPPRSKEIDSTYTYLGMYIRSPGSKFINWCRAIEKHVKLLSTLLSSFTPMSIIRKSNWKPGIYPPSNTGSKWKTWIYQLYWDLSIFHLLQCTHHQIYKAFEKLRLINWKLGFTNVPPEVTEITKRQHPSFSFFQCHGFFGKCQHPSFLFSNAMGSLESWNVSWDRN